MNNILDTATAFWRSAALFYALRLNLFEKMGGNPLAVEEIARLCGASEDFLRRLLRALTAMKMMVREGDKYHCSGDILDSIIPGRSGNLSHFVRLLGEDFSAGIWSRLPAPGAPPSFNAQVEENPPSPELFTMAMQNLAARGEAQALVDAFDLSACENLLDIGGGSGAYTISLCRRYPALTALIVDLPEVSVITRKIVVEYELDERIGVLAQDWNQIDIEGEFDAVLLSDVLYFAEQECRKIIETARKALVPGGKLGIRGYFLDDSDNRLFPALFDINLLVNNKDHSTPHIRDLAEWLQRAGFLQIQARPLTGLSYFLEAFAPSSPSNRRQTKNS